MPDRTRKVIWFPQPLTNSDGSPVGPPTSKTLPHFVAWGRKPKGEGIDGVLIDSDQREIKSVGVYKREGFWVLFFNNENLRPGTYTLKVWCLNSENQKIEGSEESEPIELANREYGPQILTPGMNSTITSHTVVATGNSDDQTNDVVGTISNNAGYFQTGVTFMHPATSLGSWAVRFQNVPNGSGYDIDIDQATHATVSVTINVNAPDQP